MPVVTIEVPSSNDTVPASFMTSGTVTPASTNVSAAVNHSDGNSYPGMPASMPGPDWTFNFENIPDGDCTLTVSPASGGGSQSIPLTVQELIISDDTIGFDSNGGTPGSVTYDVTVEGYLYPAAALITGVVKHGNTRIKGKPKQQHGPRFNLRFKQVPEATACTLILKAGKGNKKRKTEIPFTTPG